MQSHHLEIKKTARYWTYGNLTPQTQNVWFVCHGYGQLAEYFIKKFAHLDPDKNFVVAPEALSRFYLKGFSDKVGATWMTKEDRLSEINDYISYLNDLYKHIFAQASLAPQAVKVYALGFSQGTNTVCRWVFAGQVKIDRLVVWAGNFPPDVDYTKFSQILGNQSITYVYGTEDELINANVFAHELNQLKLKNIPFESISFVGKHDLDAEVLQKLLTI
ncbi:MAG: phospholipase [Microscillaceae bacterium]|jgi:predicted esterase|nr:phospholipase [Microscillaceae bacterium]